MSRNLAKFVVFVLMCRCGICADVDLTCEDGNFTTDYGLISTPSFPLMYSPSLSCRWSILTTPDKVIQMTFLQLALEDTDTCDTDYLEIYDGDELYTGRKYCGLATPRDFVSSSTNVTIIFVSDASSQSPIGGFAAEWSTAVRCNGSNFGCWDGTCIPISKKCNRIQDCSDDSDEIECVQVSSNFEQCGKSSAAPSFTWDPRIVGGNSAVASSWPWQVGFVVNPNTAPFCGGSIISNNYVLTAAHCFENDVNVDSVRVEAGMYKYSLGGEQTALIDQVFRHPNYTSWENGSDIALVKLASAFTFDDTVRPICLPPPDVVVNLGVQAIATGWGRTYSFGNQPDKLYQVRLPVISNQECADRYSDATTLFASQLCAGESSKGGVDACNGDSGGPLVTLASESVWMQIGITSYGIGCGSIFYPGVYTRVSSFTPWVATYVNQTKVESTTTTIMATSTTTSGAARLRLKCIRMLGVLLLLAVLQPISTH